MDILSSTDKTDREASSEAGIHYVSLTNWRRGASAPNIADFENVAQALGYQVTLVPISEADQ